MGDTRRRMVLLLIALGAVGGVGAIGSFVGQWISVVPASSFGTAGEWLAGGAAAATIAALYLEMGTRIDERKADDRRALMGDAETASNQVGGWITSSGPRRDLRPIINAVRRVAVGVYRTPDINDTNLARAADLISAASTSESFPAWSRFSHSSIAVELQGLLIDALDGPARGEPDLADGRDQALGAFIADWNHVQTQRETAERFRHASSLSTHRMPAVTAATVAVEEQLQSFPAEAGQALKALAVLEASLTDQSVWVQNNASAAIRAIDRLHQTIKEAPRLDHPQ